MQDILFVATVKPFFHRTGFNSGTLVFQYLKCSCYLEFIFFADVFTNQVVEGIPKTFAIPEIINTYNGLIGYKILGLFHKFPDISVLIGYYYTKSGGVFEPLNPYHAVFLDIETEIRFEQGIGQGNNTRAAQTVGGAGNSVTHAQRFVLIVNAAFGAQAFGYTDEFFLHIGSEIANYIGYLFDLARVRSSEIFHEALNHWFSGNGNEWFGNSECVRAQAGSPSCHRDDDFHIKSIVLQAGTAETSGAAICVRKTVSLYPGDLLVAGNYHLCDALSRLDSLILIGEIDYDTFDFSPVVAVNGTRRVKHGQAPFGSQTATGSDLRLVAFRQLNKKPGGYECTFERTERYRR